jgi:hypothetical protein
MFHHDYEDLGLLHRTKWVVRDPYLYAGDLDSYREFIQFSRAEFSVAKSGYVKSRSGWFSDRTACYLASGKPAIIQSTHLEERLVDDAYLGHCAAARRIAETYFDSAIVLPRSSIASVHKRCGVRRR